MNRSAGLKIAVLITIVAIPLLLLLDRPKSATVQPPVTIAAIDPDKVLGTAPLPFDAVTLPPNPGGPPVIVVPDIPAGIPLKATYSSSIASARKCAIGSTDVPFGVDVTVRNVNNDRSIRCTNSLPATVDQVDLVVLPIPAYETIADVTDAPVPVEITW